VPVHAIPVAEAMPLSATPMVVEAMPMAIAEPLEALPLAIAEPMAFPAIGLDQVELAPPAPPPAPVAIDPIPAVPVAPVPAPAPPPPAPQPAATAPAPAPAAEAPAATMLPPGAQPRLLVMRGQKRNVEYPLYEGLNFIGRADEKPVDIDLEEQEPPDRIWCSRQHACVAFENNQLLLEDLNSANGTYVNRTRVYPGQKRPLSINDVIQIGNVQLKVLA
jgi:hypothetical protein